MNYSYDYFHVKISVKLLVKPLLHSFFFFTDHLNHKTVNKATLEALSKSTTTMGTLVEKLGNCWDYFLRLSGFPNLSAKVF